MRILALSKKPVEEFEAKLPSVFEVQRKEMEFSSVPWTGGEKSKIEGKFFHKLLKSIFEKFNVNIDTVIAFVPSSQWPDNGLWGWQYGERFHTYHVGVVKRRDGYENTAYHELAHTLDTYIYVNGGKRVEKILGVDDYDEDVVHGSHPDYQEYKYEDVIQILAPYIEEARQRRLQEGIIGLLRRKLRLLQVLLEQKKKEEIQEPSMLEEWGRAIKQFEGWFEGSRSQRNNNPGNLRYASWQNGVKEVDAQGFSVFSTYEYGWNALLQLLRGAAKGQFRSYDPEMTLLEFVKVYAPASDNNYPMQYTTYIADRLNVDINIKIKELL